MRCVCLRPRFAAFVLGVMLLTLAGCQDADAPSQQQPQPAVIVAKPLTIPIVEWDEYTGRLAAIDSVEVRARVSGYLESVHFDEGQLVNKGDLLAIIDPRPFQAVLNAAKARRDEAQAKLAEAKSILKQAQAEKSDADAQLQLADQRVRRAKLLESQNAISEEERDVRVSEQLQAKASVEARSAAIESAKAGIATAEAAIETAEANIETAKLDLFYTQIRAPISGRISRKQATEGNLISGGSNQSTLLTTIVSLSPIHIYFDANEQEFLKYSRLAREGRRKSSRETRNPVYISLVDETGYPHLGHMDFVDNQVDVNTGTMRGRAIFPNEDGLLTPGLFAKVRLPGSGRYDAILIPDSAINSDQSEKFVYIVTDESQVARRDVTPGPISHGLRIIRSGLEGDERVVISGIQQIYPGASVSAEEGKIEPEPSELPDDYEPVKKENWLDKAPDPIPEGIDPNATPYRSPIEPVKDPDDPLENDSPSESKLEDTTEGGTTP